MLQDTSIRCEWKDGDVNSVSISRLTRQAIGKEVQEIDSMLPNSISKARKEKNELNDD
jgi:hypothetical protein